MADLLQAGDQTKAAESVGYWEGRAKRAGEDRARTKELNEWVEITQQAAHEERLVNKRLVKEHEALTQMISDERNKTEGKIAATGEAWEKLWLAKAELNRVCENKQPLRGPLVCKSPPPDVVSYSPRVGLPG